MLFRRRANPRRALTSSDLLLPRRGFVQGGLAGVAATLCPGGIFGCSKDPMAEADASVGMDAGTDAGPRVIPPSPPLRSLMGELGPLEDPDENGVRLPAGFRSRIVARSGEPALPGGDYAWHRSPDGGATYATEDGGWIYVSNCELPLIGGVGALRFDASGTLVASYPILSRTQVNCAGGKTPWHTWLSCEEAARGRVFECDPWGEGAAIERTALGIFKHEAAAVDPVNAHVYLTEDERDGRFYRFVPDALTPEGHPNLSAGRLEAASVDADGRVEWLDVPDPRFEGDVPTRHQVEASTAFRGGEGIWYHEGTIYFTTKGDDRVWSYEIAASQLDIIYDRATADAPILRGVDNLTVSCCGDVLVAEDGGSMQVVVILPSGEPRAVLQVVGQDESEITGPAFDPSGTRLYFSSQRGEGAGLTYEVTGPFHEPA